MSQRPSEMIAHSWEWSLKNYIFRISFGGGGAPVFLLRDEFTTDEAAPLASPRTCEPGPGTLTITDVDSRFSISAGSLVIASAATACVALSGTLSRVTGRAVFMDVSGVGGANYVKLDASSSSDQRDEIWFLNSLVAIQCDGGGNVVTVDGGVSTLSRFFIIIRPNGCIFIRKVGSDYVVLYITNVLTDTVAARLTCLGSATGTCDNLSIVDLADGFSTDYGIATNRVAVPSVGETTTSEANALIEQTWTAVTGQTWNLYTRRTDDSNQWATRLDQTGSTIKLIEINAGVETERASAAQTLTNGVAYRVIVIQDGNSIKNFVANVAKNSYASATFQNTATGVKTDRAGTDLVAWPRTLSGAALAELNRYTA